MGSAATRPCIPTTAGKFLDEYDVGEMLGSGVFGQVRVCWPRTSDVDENCFAVKVVDTCSEVFEASGTYIAARDEADNLQAVRHPHIVELSKVFEEGRWLFLVMRRINGGELFQAISDPDINVSEADLATVSRQLLQAIDYLHRGMIVHRDVKAENILLSEHPRKSGTWAIKLIDFGLSTRLDKSPCCLFGEKESLQLVCGTAYYCSPEVWAGQYGAKVDVWAAGVVLYLALMGCYPFYDADQNALETKICDKKVFPKFLSACEDSVSYKASPGAEKALTSLLLKDPDTRPSAAAALDIRWLQSPGSAGSIWEKTKVGATGELALADAVIPKLVRAKAGRAAERPQVDAKLENDRTEALEVLKALHELESPRRKGQRPLGISARGTRGVVSRNSRDPDCMDSVSGGDCGTALGGGHVYARLDRCEDFVVTDSEAEESKESNWCQCR